MKKMWFGAVIWRWDVEYLIKKSEGEYQIRELELAGDKDDMTSIIQQQSPDCH